MSLEEWKGGRVEGEKEDLKYEGGVEGKLSTQGRIQDWKEGLPLYLCSTRNHLWMSYAAITPSIST